MKIVRRARAILAAVLGKSLLRCNSNIVQGEMYFVHKLCKTKCILFTMGGNFPTPAKPSIDRSREPLLAERRAHRSARQRSETPSLPPRVFRNDRLKATIFLCIKSLAQMEICSRPSLPSAALAQFSAATC